MNHITNIEGVEKCIKFQEYYCTLPPHPLSPTFILKFTSRKPLIPFVCHFISFHMAHTHTQPNKLLPHLFFRFLSLNFHIIYAYTIVCVLIYWKNLISRNSKKICIFTLLFVIDSAQNYNETTNIINARSLSLSSSLALPLVRSFFSIFLAYVRHQIK